MQALDGGNAAICLYTVTNGGSKVAVAINVSQEDTIDVDLQSLGTCTLVGTVGMADRDESSVTLSPLSCAILRTE